MKIFGVGYIKTGTTTLGVALKQLGYNHCGGGWRVGNKMVDPYISGERQPMIDLINKHDSFEDYPFCAPGMPAWLDKQFPNSKFILTEREPESWFKSLSNYLFPERLGAPVSVLKVSQRTGDLPLGKLYGLVTYLLAAFGTLEMEANKAHYIETYKAYNAQVKEMFEGTGRLLTVSWMQGQGWGPLCKFLGKPIPTRGFPHLNRGKK
jgi:hypothetical protein